MNTLFISHDIQKVHSLSFSECPGALAKFLTIRSTWNLVMKFTILMLVLSSMTSSSEGHGRMIDPPQRSSLWRFGFDAPINNDDHSLDCGGMGVQYSAINQGRCGLCGDRFDLPQPRPHEAGGEYGRGIISRYYKEGETIQVLLEITVAHGGWSEFRLCPNNDIHKVTSQECLDKYQLKIPGSGKRFYHSRVTGIVKVSVELPRGLTCSQCVLQWRWKTDSSNNCNPSTKENCCIGCGVQEEFFNCADVSIYPASKPLNQSTALHPLLPGGFLQIPVILPEKPLPNIKDVSKVSGFIPLDLLDAKQRMATCIATPVWQHFLGQDLANSWCRFYCDENKCPLNLCTKTCQV